MPLTRAYLGLGSNIDPEANLPAAVGLLGNFPGLTLLARSPVYRTPPWGNTNQPPFLNAVLEVETDLPPVSLLDAIQAVENSLNRVRNEHWGPRTMDVDLLLCGEMVLDDPRLVLPHPHMHERAFVLIPLCDIAPAAIHSISGKSMAELLEEVSEEEKTGIEPVSLPNWQD